MKRKFLNSEWDTIDKFDLYSSVNIFYHTGKDFLKEKIKNEIIYKCKLTQKLSKYLQYMSISKSLQLFGISCSPQSRLKRI